MEWSAASEPAVAQALAAARPALPYWVPWLGPVLLAVATGLLALGCIAPTYFLCRRAILRTDATPWPERARVVFAAKQAMLSAIIIALAADIVISSFFGGSYLARYGTWPSILCGGCIAAFGTLSYRALANLGSDEQPTLWVSTRSAFTALILLRGVLVPLLLGTVAAPPELGPRAFVVLGLAALATAALVGGGGLAILRGLGLARPARPRATRIVNPLAQRMGVEVRAVYEIDWAVANAVALTVNKAIAFTPLILEKLDDEELAAVTAHELTHLREPSAVMAGRIAVPFAALPIVLGIPVTNTYGWAGLLLLLLVPLLLLRAFAVLFRRMEERADAGSHRETDSTTHARALEKIYHSNLIPAVLARRTTHPNLYDRLLAAGVEPPYERPQPPSKKLAFAASCLGLSVVVALLVGILVLQGLVQTRSWEDERFMAASLAIGNASVEYHLAALASMRANRAERHGAEPLYRAAAIAAAAPWRRLALESCAVALQGDCAAAQSLRERALAKLPPQQSEHGLPWELYESEIRLAGCSAGLRM